MQTSASFVIAAPALHLALPCHAVQAKRPQIPLLMVPVARRHQLSRSKCSAVVCASAGYGSEWSTPQDAYLTLGVATCFEKGDDGRLQERRVIEPISANSLECMANGAKTCFSAVTGVTMADALARSKASLPAEFADAIFCEEFETRCDSCARTWMRPHALDNLLDIVPLGQVKSAFNYDLTDKRVLNMENVVTDDDNVKQDMSIDVYGRKQKESEDAAAAEASAAAEKEEVDELDGLLAG